MKRFILRITVFLIVISLMLPPLFALGYTKEAEGEAALLQEGNYNVKSLNAAEISLSAKALSSVEEAIYNGLKQEKARIELGDYNVPDTDIEDILANVINDNADLFFVSSSFGYSYYSDHTVAALVPQYAITGDALEEAQEIFDSGVQRALAEITPDMSDLQKALTIHDYICSLANYPTVYDENGNFVPALDKDIYHSAYGFFLNHTVVCAGYTLAYSYLLGLLGIECEYVASDPMSHAWNKLKIDGKWYNADLTFDDSDEGNDETTYGSMLHSYFLKSDSYFASNAGIVWHYGGTTFDGCSATSTDYDNAFWNDVTARIYSVDGYYYYLDPPASSSVYVILKKRSQSGTETNVCPGFNSTSLSYSGAFFDENDEQHVYTYKDCLARLCYLDGRFYVAYTRNLVSVLKDGTKYTITPISTYPTGLGDNGKGNLLYHLYNTDNALYELDKEEYFSSHITAQKGVNYNNYPDINLDGVINGKDYAKIYKAKNS